MSDSVISFIFAAGASAWVYSKTNQRFGYGNAKDAYIAAGITFVLAFVFLYSLMHFALHI
jgi:hypothetical protein